MKIIDKTKQNVFSKSSFNKRLNSKEIDDAFTFGPRVLPLVYC